MLDIDALVSTHGVVPACQPPGQAFMDHRNLLQAGVRGVSQRVECDSHRRTTLDLLCLHRCR
jgi:hypothetical protein